MNDNDTSDEAAYKYYRNWVGDPDFGHIKMWQECRRRSEAKAEERERKAFEVGWNESDTDTRQSVIDAAYRAFKEGK